MESPNTWRFMYSAPFQMLIKNEVIKYGVISYFNDIMAKKLDINNINNISFTMYDIQKSATGYYFKFTLDYIDKNLNRNPIFTIADNLHISFHQRGEPYNQTHIKATKNGRTADIPITFSKIIDIKIHILHQSVTEFLDKLELNQHILQINFRLTDLESYILYQNIGNALYNLSNILPRLFDTIDEISLFLGYGPIELPREIPARQASTMAGGGYFINKYIKYKLKYLELKKINEN